MGIIQSQLLAYAACCTGMCLTFLTWQLVLSGRMQYAGLESNEQRRQFMETHENMKEAAGASFKYTVPATDGTRMPCCSKAWRFVYGVSEWAHKKKAYRKSGSSKKFTKRSKHFGRRERMMISWLKAYASKAGCKLPFSEHAAPNPVIRLPFPTKVLVHKVYKNQLRPSKNVLKPLDFPRFTSVWKNSLELSHIKCSKYKPGFSKCDVCKEYETNKLKKITPCEREILDRNFLKHVEEFMSEKNQYYGARAKAVSNSHDYISIIMDAMDQRKTRIPFWTNPAKIVAHCFLLKLKLFCAIVHGYGSFYFWCTEQVKHDTNLAIEVLHRVLLKYQREKGDLPPVLYLQLDNGPDQKSKQFLAFIAYLVQMKVFNKIKVSYLLVGHTHEDPDQAFSHVGRFFRKVVQTILSVSSFIAALMNCFKTPTSIPRCVEQISYCYDTTSLKQILDQNFARFDLAEETFDKCHYFVFKRNKEGRACMQYKHKRYSDALMPRQFDVGSKYTSSVNGLGTVIACEPEKDVITKEKFWNYTIRYEPNNDQPFETVKRSRASKFTIVMFPDAGQGYPEMPAQFPTAKFTGTFDDCLGMQKTGIDEIIRKLKLREKDPDVCESWDAFWLSVPREIDVPQELTQPFEIPHAQKKPTYIVAKKRPAAVLDDGNRPIQVVTHQNYRKTDRDNAKKQQTQEGLDSTQLDKLEKGDTLLLNLLPENNDKYKLPFVLAHVDSNISNLDTTDKNTIFPVQILRPIDLVSLTNKFVKWKGDDNRLWRPSVERSQVRMIVQMTKTKKLTSRSQALIRSTFPSYFCSEKV